jgi:hypothetical protein
MGGEIEGGRRRAEVEAETGVGAEEDEGRKKTKFIYVLIEGRS